ncbi:MAG: ATP-binding protein [Myxococcota bacterium]
MSRPPSGSIVAGTRADTRWTRLVHRSPAWLGLLVVAVIAIASTLRPTAPGLQDLSGLWDARVGSAATAPIELPGLFRNAGLPSESRVLATREVVSGSEPLALLVDRPQYAVTATWDGTPIGSAGDPAAEGRDARTSRALFVVLPTAPPGSRHRLGLDLRGDYGKGGVLGRILVGPVAQVHAAARSTEVQRLAFSLGLSLLAALPLVVATRGPRRPAYVSFGLFASSVAIQSGAQSSLAYDLLPDALAVTRLLRTVTPLVSPLGVSFVALFVHGRLLRPDLVVWGAAAVLAALGLVAPPSWLYGLEVAGELLVVAAAIRYAQHAVTGLRARIPGTAMLLAAVAPVTWAIVSEITLTHGLRAGGSQMMLAGLLFMTALGAALVLRDAEVSEQHERLVRGSLDAMVTVDPSGRIRDANPAAHRLLGPLFGGAAFLRYVSPPERPLVRAHLLRAVQRADRTEFRTTERRVLESLATPLGPELMILTLRDITIRRELDQGLLQTARMETMGLLLGGIAHDFNNMLSTLIAHLGLLRTQVSDPATRERLDRMESAVDRASERTRRLLTVARGTGSDLGPVDLNAVVAGATELVEPTLPPGVELEVSLLPNLQPVLGAAGDLEQVIVNLLMNARDAVGDRGHLRVAARSFHGDHGRGIVLLVEDDGPGIPDDRKNEVFQPFITTKPRGTGLGLAVARQILRDHHGRIWVEDRPGGGTRFLVALRHADAVDEAPTPLPKGRSILLVEDEQVLLEDYGRALLDAGYTVAPFATGSDAALWLSTHKPDVLVTDVVMPGFNGLELARICLELYPETPVLFVSAFVPHENLRVLPEGTWHALHKPVRAARLVATVGRIRRRAERRSAGDDEITWVTYLFPDLTDLTAVLLGFDEP